MIKPNKTFCTRTCTDLYKSMTYMTCQYLYKYITKYLIPTEETKLYLSYDFTFNCIINSFMIIIN